MPRFTYDPESDASVFLHNQVVVQGLTYDISAGTLAGCKEPGGAQKPNEDAFSVVVGERGIAAAVFDGASSQKPIPELGDTSGARFASHELKQMFERSPMARTAGIMVSVLNRQIGETFRAFPSVDFKDLNSLPTSTATIGQIDTVASTLDIGHVGDSFALLLRDDGSTERLTNNLHRRFDRVILRRILDVAIEQGITPREARGDSCIRKAIMEMFQNTRNRPDGTGEGMVNGDRNMDRYIDTATISLEGVRAILLGSDGLVPPGMDESEEEDRKILFGVACTEGIEGLVNYTRRIQDADPDRWMVRYKHSDDATGMLIKCPVAA